jgi:hypothetical protein
LTLAEIQAVTVNLGFQQILNGVILWEFKLHSKLNDLKLQFHNLKINYLIIKSEEQDCVFELCNMLINAGVWYEFFCC